MVTVEFETKVYPCPFPVELGIRLDYSCGCYIDILICLDYDVGRVAFTNYLEKELLSRPVRTPCTDRNHCAGDERGGIFTLRGIRFSAPTAL
jgi:hypothetical protein